MSEAASAGPSGPRGRRLPGTWLVVFGLAAALTGAEIIAPLVFLALTGYLPFAVIVTTAVTTTLVGLPLLYFFVRLAWHARGEADRANATESALRRMTQHYRAVGALNRLIAQRPDEETLWRDACDVLTAQTSMTGAMIGIFSTADDAFTVRAMAGAAPYAAGERRGEGPTHRLLRQAVVEARAATATCSDRPDRLMTALPLYPTGGGMAVLLVSLEASSDDASLHGLLAETAQDIAHAADNAHRDLRLELNIRAVDSSADAIVILDDRWRIVSANPAFSRISGYAPQALRGIRAYALLPWGRRRSGMRAMTRTLLGQGYWRGDTVLRRSDDSTCPLAGSVARVDGDAGSGTYYVAVFQDVGEQRELERQVRHLAYHDALTGLANRYRVDEYLAGLLLQQTRTALLFIDIDHFKRVNDAQGHSVGDRILQAAAERIRKIVGRDELAARLGGDEFAVIARDADRESAARLGRCLVERLGESPYSVDGRQIHVTASAAVALFPDDGDRVEVLRQNVDRALRHAKNDGRNRCVVFEGWMREHAERQVAIERDLRHALIIGDQLEMHYQPVVASDDGRMLGLEALVRWRHPGLGLLVADQFVPTAEAVGMMRELDDWVLDAVLQQLRGWERAGLDMMRVAVNLSVAQCSDQTYPARVAAAIERSGLLHREWLAFEILENVLIEDSPAQQRVLSSLRESGHRLILDDWGRGYARLEYLSRANVDGIKIDKTFVQRLPDDPRSLVAVRTVLQLGRELDIDVIAEGVETPAQRACLQVHGCPALQGYLVARPMDAETLLSWLREARAKGTP
ncbi:putative bifunctional diguanylate cyclase/phosphodiesterase [Acidihalobacter prosperus]|uniref:GGDEF domain-containing protein n=1 Tax=Acidihalobacter prosperus TaxID=160660 RepID=A0A1A6C6G8_9GAMM|nr:GGDEF and EAL domain-containing protein [Acidihalobacter prosperus]OBS10130.1 GGDEF domain-containing protein [Acidihalobacter prosperus]